MEMVVAHADKPLTPEIHGQFRPLILDNEYIDANPH